MEKEVTSGQENILKAAGKFSKQKFIVVLWIIVLSKDRLKTEKNPFKSHVVYYRCNIINIIYVYFNFNLGILLFCFEVHIIYK